MMKISKYRWMLALRVGSTVCHKDQHRKVVHIKDEYEPRPWVWWLGNYIPQFIMNWMWDYKVWPFSRVGNKNLLLENGQRCYGLDCNDPAECTHESDDITFQVKTGAGRIRK